MLNALAKYFYVQSVHNQFLSGSKAFRSQPDFDEDVGRYHKCYTGAALLKYLLDAFFEVWHCTNSNILRA